MTPQSRPSSHTSTRPAARTVGSSGSLTKSLGKGKQKERKKSLLANEPSPSTPAKVIKPVEQEAEASQKNGPLGAPILSTSDPQILMEEAEDEEDETTPFQVGEPTPDETSPGAAESRQWNDETRTANNSKSPLYGSGGEDEFHNPWEGRS